MFSAFLQPTIGRNAEAYKTLYLIENHLRYIIRFSENEPPYNATLYDLIDTAQKIPQKERRITNEVLEKLYWVVEIRNKTCHMHPINDRELVLLNECWREALEAYRQFVMLDEEG